MVSNSTQRQLELPFPEALCKKKKKRQQETTDLVLRATIMHSVNVQMSINETGA